MRTELDMLLEIQQLQTQNATYRKTIEAAMELIDALKKGVAHTEESFKKRAAAEQMGRSLMLLAPALLGIIADRGVSPLSVVDTGVLDCIAAEITEADMKAVRDALWTRPGGKEIYGCLLERVEAYRNSGQSVKKGQ